MPTDVKQTAERISTERLEKIAVSYFEMNSDNDTVHWDQQPGRVRTQTRKAVRQVLAAIDIVDRAASRHAEAQEGGEATDTKNTVSDADWLEDAARYFENRNTGGEDMAFWANVSNAERCRSIAKSLRASIPGGVGVKGLEWSQGWGERRASTPFGDYRLSANTSGAFDWHSPDGGNYWASTEDKAKAAAQADYERRILSSLEASPAPVSEEMVERLIEFATDVGRHSPKIVPMGANPPLFDGMQDDTDGAWLNRVGTVKRIRSFFAALAAKGGQ